MLPEGPAGHVVYVEEPDDVTTSTGLIAGPAIGPSAATGFGPFRAGAFRPAALTAR